MRIVLFQRVQVSLYSGVVNMEEFVRRSHHVDTVGLSLRAFLVHELVHRFVLRGDVYKRQVQTG